MRERIASKRSTEVDMLPYYLVLFAIAARFLPHAGSFNFTPVAASLLFFGAQMPRKRAWIPVALFVASDVLISHFVYGFPMTVSFNATFVLTWAWYAAIVLMGSLLASNTSALRVVGASLVASFSFFAISNFAVWAVWDMYPKTLAGLATCYTMAIPFFRNTAASDLLFSGAFFGLAALMPQLVRKVQHPIA